MGAKQGRFGTESFPQIGGISGAISAFTFALIHDIFISDIWFSLGIMMVAGAICGASVSWSYGVLINTPSLKSWLVYNLLYDGMFVIIGLVSVFIFEPITTMAAVVTSSGPPDRLILEALPFTAVFTLVMALIITILYSRNQSSRLKSFTIVLITSTLLMLLLGLNVSIIGLVSIPAGSFYLVIEMFVLIFVINIIYMAVFVFVNSLRLQLVFR